MKPQEAIRDIVSGIVCGLIDSRESLAITVSGGPNSVTIMLSCEKLDLPKVIGKQGRNINSIKCLCAAISAKAGYRFNLIIEE
jgi:predicted RNA-binding protein YlqC (UPF0109 family)